MSGIRQIILERAAETKEEVIRLRRHFHRNPELSFIEYSTAAYVTSWLEEQGIQFRQGIAGTGIIAAIVGEGNGDRVIAIRAELDALPITEKNTTEYASCNTGVMHACGHDAHMAMLMGTALVLKSLRQQFGGTILLVFQPGEEKAPGGAKLVLEAGALNNPPPDIVIAQHILPELDSGRAGFRAGRYMASCDEIYISVTGKGGHAALPGMSTDQIYIASQLVVRLKEEMKRKQAGIDIPTVLGIGRFIGEGATNVIPETVEIAGTFRTFDETWRKEALDLIRNTAADVAAESGVSITVRIAEGYPVLVNDDKLTAKAVSLSKELLGDESTELLDLRMSSDDFSFYSSIAPTLYYRIGIRKKDSDIKKLHTADFDLDEDALEKGVANMAWLVYNFLTEKP